jgi:hypothetical protein
MIRACGADDVAWMATRRKLRFQMIDRKHAAKRLPSDSGDWPVKRDI